MKHCEIDIIIDGITPCLKDNVNNKYVDTTYEIINPISHKAASEMQKYEKWKFD